MRNWEGVYEKLGTFDEKLGSSKRQHSDGNYEKLGSCPWGGNGGSSRLAMSRLALMSS